MAASPPRPVVPAHLPAILWIVSRLVVLVITLGWFNGDTETYFRQGRLWLDGQIPYREIPIEYPPAAALLFLGIAAVTGSYARFRVGFILTALVVDGLIYRQLAARLATLRPLVGYAVATALLYPILLLRFDLFPCAAVFVAVLRLSARQSAGSLPPSPRHDVVTGTWLGAGVALKLYPLLFFPFLALEAFRRRLPVRTFVILCVTTAAVVVLSFVAPWLAGAGDAVFSFLRYQGERGLQIESVWSSLLLVLSTFTALPAYHLPSHGAHDVAGQAADAILPFARALHPLAILIATAVAHMRRLPIPHAFALVLASALVTSTVFSPQFLLWLLPLAFLALPERRALPVVAIGIGALTTLVFPILYPKLLTLAPVAIYPLAVRNALLVTLLVLLAKARVSSRS